MRGHLSACRNYEMACRRVRFLQEEFNRVKEASGHAQHCIEYAYGYYTRNQATGRPINDGDAIVPQKYWAPWEARVEH